MRSPVTVCTLRRPSTHAYTWGGRLMPSWSRTTVSRVPVKRSRARDPELTVVATPPVRSHRPSSLTREPAALTNGPGAAAAVKSDGEADGAATEGGEPGSRVVSSATVETATA